MRWFRDIRFITSMTSKKSEKIEIFSKIRFLTLDNIDFDDALCDLYWTKGPLPGYISSKNFKRIREERQDQKHKEPKKRLKNESSSFSIAYKTTTKFCLNSVKF